ncbi:S1 family peptidase [Rhodopirellula halodulae]|uniref:S1 family peptidase n=1 Tax=Rhodopirellula halodulae TaxID=2894198 RepID=UPI001E44CC6F|nr:serine protease [Rhodopirellula sp. JC737]MCC9656080.1 serine protease [Rhodopirellula sp. JC737]
MKKTLTLICGIAVAAEFGYLLLKDHPHWPEIVWTPGLWIPPSSPDEGSFKRPMAEDSTTSFRAMEASGNEDSSVSPGGLTSDPTDQNAESAKVESIEETDSSWADKLFEPDRPSEEGSVDSAAKTSDRSLTTANTDLLARSMVQVRRESDEIAIGQTGRRQNDGWTGAGVIVKVDSEGFWVLTAQHVVARPVSLEIELLEDNGGGGGGPLAMESHSLQAVELVGKDQDRDLALLRVEWPLAMTRGIQAVDWAGGGHVSSGEEVLVCEFTGENRWEWDRATLVERKTAKREHGGVPIEYLVLSNPSKPGMSGGGAFTASGKLCGIISGNGAGQMHCIAVTEIDRFMATVSVEER